MAEKYLRGSNQPFAQPLHQPLSFKPSFLSFSRLFLNQAISFAVSSFFLCIVVTWACLVSIRNSLLRTLRPPISQTKKYDWDKRPEAPEKVTKGVAYYARAIGLDIRDETIETEDGFYLRLHRVINPNALAQNNDRGRF
jgi:lysosomal acid lipase/cholesteryl ester hydrolase